jgi:hypothetical protein
MKDFLKRMFSYFRGETGRVVIEQQSYYDAMEKKSVGRANPAAP